MSKQGLWKMINCGKNIIKISNKWFNVMFAKYVVRNILCIFHFPKIPRFFPYNNNLLKKDVETGNVPQSRARGHSITTSTILCPLLTTYLPLREHFYPKRGQKKTPLPTSYCTRSFWTTPEQCCVIWYLQIHAGR